MAKDTAMISSGVVCRELIGRESELGHLLARTRWDAGRDSAVVILRGEAGVGKTRLVTEFASAAGERGVRVVSCSAREYASASYAPIVEALEQLGAPRAFDDAEASPDGVDDKTRRFGAVAAQFASLGAAAPNGLAVVVEDAHWADGGTIELLRFLARRLAGERVLFVVTYRSDDLETDSARARSLGLLEREAGQTIALEPLRGDDIERLLRSILRDAGSPLSPPLLAEIRDLSDGRPLFAEELLRGVLERIARDGNARAIVPTSIRATVRERFAELAADDRDVLLHAAVVGKRFSAQFLTELMNREPATVFRALRRARDRQLVVEEGDEDGDGFAFRHALTREAVYAELLRAEARVLHAQVAAALARERDLDVTAIAEHTYRARDAEHALAWNELAGDEASAVFAHADAALHYERAHEFATETRQRGELAHKTGDALYATGALEQAVVWLSRAIDDFAAGDDASRVLQLASRRAYMRWEAGAREHAISELREIVGSLPDDSGALRFEAETILGGLLNASGRAAEALDHLAIARELVGFGEPHGVTRFHGVYGFALALIGRPAEAREPFAVAIERARTLGDDDVLLRTLNNFGNAELSAGTVAAARALYDDALAVAERTKNLRVVAWVSQNAAGAALIGGDLEAARRHLLRSRSIEHEVPSVHRWRAALTLRLLTLVGGERAAQRREAAAAFEQSLGAGDEQAVGMLAAVVAFDALAEGRAADAQRAVRIGLAETSRPDAPYWLLSAAARVGDPADRARARAVAAAAAAREDAWGARGVLALGDAREAWRKRKRGEAEAHAAAAVAEFRRAGWVLDEADALELAGQVAEAVAIFRRIGATAEVRRLTETEVAAPRRRGEATLTAREREIVNLVLAGGTARGIADALVISERTVETHIAAAYRKLGVSNRGELATLVGDPPAAAGANAL